MYLKNSITVALPEREVKVYNRLTGQYETGLVPDQTFLTPRVLTEEEIELIGSEEIARFKKMGIIFDNEEDAVIVHNKEEVDLDKDSQINRDEIKN